ncbi:hypothetical protein BLA29_006114 [Euroglyphus maynei]|uniref:Uncharacterized protein n=1 Tax=Euroglyphus maynei TaxID=6958 RepID=A0A1Y3BQF8_EURMA|nr:hypothetical protein BLA29_006114 [Euroglyphus maynei]
MNKRGKNNPNKSAASSDSESENLPNKQPKTSESMDVLITDPNLIVGLNFRQCYDVIHNSCSIDDKRSFSKYADVIVAAADVMKKLYDDLSSKLCNNADESNKILLEIRDKLNAPIPYNLVAAKPKIDPNQPVPTKSNEFSLFVNAKDGIASNEINSKVNQVIIETRKIKPNLKINKVIRNSKGNIIKIPNSKDLDILLEQFRNNNQFDNIANVFIPKPRDPTIVLKKVNKFTESKDIPNILSRVNEQLAGLESDIKVLFDFRSNLYHRDVVLRVSPKVFEIISKNDILFTDLEAVKFHHRVFVRQCKYCFQFSHRSIDCPKKNNPTCADCGIDGTHQCTKINKCYNCINYFKNNAKPELLCHRPNHTN